MSTSPSYKTIAHSSEILHKDRGSKFIGISFQVETVDNIKLELDQLKGQYPDATHICYAYVLGLDQETYRANDDGEPNNSAGQPILREIKSADLTNLLVAVIRYYGGKKLGVSGLIDAYGTAAKLAIEASGVTQKIVHQRCWLRHNGAKDFMIYEYANRLGYTIVQSPSRPGDYFEIEIPLETITSLRESLESLPNFDLQLELNGR